MQDKTKSPVSSRSTTDRHGTGAAVKASSNDKACVADQTMADATGLTSDTLGECFSFLFCLGSLILLVGQGGGAHVHNKVQRLFAHV